jgi:hypothetical protein
MEEGPVTQSTICACGSPFDEEDVFCGECGEPRSGPSVTDDGEASFFGHATARPAGRMSNATRYLCAAAHLDPFFAGAVIRELIGSHRAVAPSRGIDLIPVIRHCLLARRMRLARDAVLTCLLILGVFVALGPLLLILAIAFCLAFLPRPGWERRSFGGKTIISGIGGLLAAAIVIYLFTNFVGSLDASGAAPPLPSLQLNGGTLLAYGRARNLTLIEALGPDAPAPRFERSRELTEIRLEQINDAQYGNLTIYSGEDPFIGTGGTPFAWRKVDERVGSGERAWSIAIELNRESGSGGSDPRGQVRVDPVEVHQVLRKRLLGLNDPGLPANERVTALTVDDHVVGEGRFRWDSPLIDPDELIPYSQASPEAVEALIRNPQARLRYYQRVSISDEGQTVLAADQPVIGSVDQEVVVSAFVYVAVEGYMFYLQFVPTSLPPIADRYHVVDQLPKMSSGRFNVKVVLDAARTAFGDIISSPFRVVGTLWQMWQESRSYAEGLTLPRDTVYADIGARISVRQRGARDRLRTYIQQLDVSKYTQIVERLVLDTVLDYLVAMGVDTTAYQASAQAIYNSGIIVAGDVRDSTLTSH